MTNYILLLKDGSLIDTKGANLYDAFLKSGVSDWSDVQDFEFESLEKLGE